MDYTPSGQRTAITYTNGVTTRYAYDIRLRLTHLQSSAGQHVLQDLTYFFDQVSNIVAITDTRPLRTLANDQTQHFDYDRLYHLTQATGTYGEINYAYDSLSNMVYQSSTISDTRLNLGVMRYGEANAGPHALTFAGDESYRYDANGNQLGKGNTIYTWNPRDWLASATDKEITSTYGYDAEGQRIRQTVQRGSVITTTIYPAPMVEVRGQALVWYILDDEKRVAEVKTAFDSARLIQGFNRELTVRRESTRTNPLNTLWYVSDHLGGTSLLVNAAAEITSEIVYYPYGLTRYEANGRSVQHRFTDKELDASGPYYYGARYYDPLIGHFISSDPVIADVSNPNAFNSYSYSYGNPLIMVDPTGLAPECSICSFEDNEGSVITPRKIIFNIKVTTETSSARPPIDTVVGMGRIVANAGEAVGTVSLAKDLHSIIKFAVEGTLKVAQKLFSHETFQVTQEGIVELENHLEKLGSRLDPPNAQMIERLKSGNISEYEQNFYIHELRESELMSSGLDPRTAHLETLKWQEIPYEPG